MKSQPTLARDQMAQDDPARHRHEDEHDQRVGREHGHAPVLVVAKAHLLVGEELVVVEGVALVDGAQAFDVHGPVHDEAVHGPLEDVGEQEGDRDRQPLERLHVMDVLQVDGERCRAHGVDDDDVQVAVIPAHDARAILLAEGLLPFGDHGGRPLCASDISGLHQPCGKRQCGPGSRTIRLGLVVAARPGAPLVGPGSGGIRATLAARHAGA